MLQQTQSDRGTNTALFYTANISGAGVKTNLRM